MGQNNVVNKRRNSRYVTNAKVEFRIEYDFRAEVSFKIDEEILDGREQRYSGYSRDISVQGLSFETAKALEPGDILWIDLHLPNSQEVFSMHGEVCWCRPSGLFPEDKCRFQAGVEILRVNGVEVAKTIYFDKTYNVIWSELLEKVLGTFARINRKSP
ncbi:MAG: PilZ domain-containing protein [Candidatus Omnitrophota bacterium]